MEFVIVGTSAAVAGIVQNIAGFGAGIILMMILPHFYGVLGAPALNTGICMVMTTLLAIRYRKYLSFRTIVVPLACFLLTTVTSIWLVGGADLHLLGIAFGIFFIVLALYFMFVQKNLKVSGNPIVGAVCGLISGALSGLFSIGAPTMALYFRAVTEDRNHYFASLQTLLAVANTVSTITRINRGLYPADLILPSVVGFLGLLAGQFIGSKVGKNLDAEKLNQFIYIMVLLSGINTLVKYIR